MANRLTNPFLQHLLQQFNAGQSDAAEAAHHLQISRAHLSRLRTRWRLKRAEFAAQPSGGDHWPEWPPEASQFLKAFVPLQKPPNFQLVADELASRFGFQRHRQSVAAFVRTHFPNLSGQAPPRLKARRRWERAQLSELWQHDSSIHQWWPAPAKQTLRLTVKDHSRKLLGAVFVPTDTTWNHFEHFRRRLLQHGLPLVIHTNGLSRFGHDSSAFSAPFAPPRQCRLPERLSGPQLAHCPNQTGRRHRDPSSAASVLGRGSTPCATAKYLAGNLGKLLALNCLLLNSHGNLLLNSRRHR